MPFPPTCARGRAEVKQAAPPTVTAQHKDAGKCDHSIKNSINKRTSDHCLETRWLPLFSGARTWLEHIVDILLNHAGRWIRLFLPRCKRSWNPFPGRSVSSGGNPRNKLGTRRFWLGLTKATLQKKTQETGKEGYFEYSVHITACQCRRERTNQKQYWK